jgi:hypothetical protein
MVGLYRTVSVSSEIDHHTSSIVPEHDQLSILDLFLDDGDLGEVPGDFPEDFTIHEDARGTILENLRKS